MNFKIRSIDGEKYNYTIKKNKKYFKLDVGNHLLLKGTGILDTDKNEIFEGDIVKNGTHILYIIYWDKFNAGFYMKDKDTEKLKYGLNQVQHLKIIGNIFKLT